MDRARRLIEIRVPKLGGNIGVDGVENWLICQVVLREAEALIDGKPPATQPAALK